MRTIFSLLLVFTSTFISAQKKCNYKIDSAAILKNTNLQGFIDSLQVLEISTKNDKKHIPKGVQKALNCWAGKFSIANPVEPFQATDVVLVGKKLPWRRIIYLGTSNNYLIMSYQHGGPALFFRILLVKFENDKIIDIWTGYGAELRTKSEILRYLNSQKNKDQSIFYL
jgi:hypothetical protein